MMRYLAGLRNLSRVFCFLLLVQTAWAREPAPDLSRSLVRITVTAQPFDYGRPWQGRRPQIKQGLGVLLSEQRILTSASLIENAVHIWMLKATGTDKYEGRVVAADFASDLALLTADDDQLFSSLQALEIAPEPQIGDTLEALQLEENGGAQQTKVNMNAVEIWRNPWGPVLIYRISGTLRFRMNHYTLPILAKSKVVGMLNWYRPENAEGGCSSLPFLNNFLERVASGQNPYPPKLGMSVTNRDSRELRKFRQVPPQLEGVFVDRVQADRSAAKGGILSGDLLLSVNGYKIDREGQVLHPRYGRIYWALIVPAEGKPGSGMPMTLWREGQELEVKVPMESYDPCDDVSPLMCPTRPPRYLMEGGFIFVELSEPYLQQWGKAWQTQAPLRLLTYNAFQFEIFEIPRKIVVLAQVFPSEQTLGLSHKLSNAVIKTANGKTILSLDDLAEALESPKGEFQELELEGEPYRLVFDAAQARELTPKLKKEYGIE
ncbi:MAG: serine protease [Deltaproteobacteria bacterium]|nr:serine protease [Deltaproteobacteria bacterium]